MISNNKKLQTHISTWIKDQVSTFGAKGIIVNMDNNHPGAQVLAFMCKEARIFVTAVTTHTCSLWPEKHNIKYIDYTQQLRDLNPIDNNFSSAALRTEATLNKFIVAGHWSKTENLLCREYPNLNPAHILPLADITYSELCEFHSFLFGPDYINSASDSHLGNTCLSIKEIEWATERYESLIRSDKDPTKYANWFAFTSRQKEVIAKLNQIEKITRYKNNPNLPICSVRNVDGLVVQ